MPRLMRRLAPIAILALVMEGSASAESLTTASPFWAVSPAVSLVPAENQAAAMMSPNSNPGRVRTAAGSDAAPVSAAESELATWSFSRGRRELLAELFVGATPSGAQPAAAEARSSRVYVANFAARSVVVESRPAAALQLLIPDPRFRREDFTHGHRLNETVVAHEGEEGEGAGDSSDDEAVDESADPYAIHLSSSPFTILLGVGFVVLFVGIFFFTQFANLIPDPDAGFKDDAGHSARSRGSHRHHS